MKKVVLGSLFLLTTIATFAQKDSTRSGGLFKKASGILGGKSGSGSSLSGEQIAAGLKEALSVGAEKSAKKLSSPDGFLKDAAVKILLPPEVVEVEKKMRMLGMGKLLDNTITSMNRAAEDASKSAAPIFVSAVKQMSITDALGILKGQDTSATAYLRKATTSELTTAFRPVIEQSLVKMDVNKYWKDVFSAYNKFSSTPVNTDMNAYVTERALNGLFYYVGQEEKNIRANPAARVSDILKSVFGK
ncbi:MAG: DUF4197 domain-containing protein [Chitinophagaceae bacterium]|nr:DUF4197 domain-containing protein [Chitinophagaceae bacterium]